MKGQYNIPAVNLEKLKAKFEKLNNKAKKLSCDQVTLDIIKFVPGKETITGDIIDAHYVVEVDGISPKIEGWELLARIEHTENGNILYKVPGADINTDDYRNTKSWCDHCNSNRKRKDTFLVVDEQKQLKQVGSSCLSDFLGHQSPKSIALTMEFIYALQEPSELGSVAPREIPTLYFIAYVAACVEQFGWCPSSVSNEKNTPTKTSAYNYMFPCKDFVKAINEGKIPKLKLDWEKHLSDAGDILEWARGINSDNTSMNDFLYNLHVACMQDTMNAKHIGIVAASHMAFNKAKDQDIKKQEILKSWKQRCELSKHVGEVKKREVFTLTYDKVRTFDSEYGLTYIYNFTDSEGNSLIWFTGNDQDFKQGEEYSLKATVKEHKEYKGMKQTIITRCKVVGE